MLTGSQDGLIRIISILPNSMLGVVGEHGDFPVETLALSHDRYESHSSVATALKMDFMTLASPALSV